MKLFYSSGLPVYEGDRILYFHRGLDRWVFGQVWHLYDFAVEERPDGISEKMPWAILAGDSSARTAFWIFGSETETLLQFELVFAIRGIVPQAIQDRIPAIAKCFSCNGLNKCFEAYFADAMPTEEDRETGRFTCMLFAKRDEQMKTYRGAMYASGIEVKPGDVVLCEDMFGNEARTVFGIVSEYGFDEAGEGLRMTVLLDRNPVYWSGCCLPDGVTGMFLDIDEAVFYRRATGPRLTGAELEKILTFDRELLREFYRTQPPAGNK